MLQEPPDSKEAQALWVPPDPLATVEQLDHQDPMVSRDLKEQLVLWGQMASQVVTEIPDPKDSQETGVRPDQ